MDDIRDIEKSILELRTKINRMLENIYSLPESHEHIYGEWTPPIDMLEDKDDIIIRVDLPGLSVEQIDLSIVEDTLAISGERVREQGREDENFHVLERQHGRFARKIKLPTQVNSDEAKATYKNGVLTVRLPKIKEVKSSEIEVK